MKKFVSMAMVAAMTVSMVPATAFAASNVDATAKVVGSWTEKDTFGDLVDPTYDTVPELQLRITDDSNMKTNGSQKTTLTVTLDNADFIGADNKKVAEGADLSRLVGVRTHDATASTPTTTPTTVYEYEKVSENKLKELMGHIYNLAKDGTSLPADADKDMFMFVEADINDQAVTGGTYEPGDEVPFYNDRAVTGGMGATGGDLSQWAQYYLTAAGGENMIAAVTTGTVPVAATTVRDAAFEAYLEAQDLADVKFAAFNTATQDWTAIKSGAVITEAEVVTWTASNASVVAKATGLTAAQVTAALSGGAFTNTTASVGTKSAWVDAAWAQLKAEADANGVWVYTKASRTGSVANNDGSTRTFDITAIAKDTNELEITIDGAWLEEDDVIYVDLESILDKTKDAYVSVESDDITISNDSEDLLYVDVADAGVAASIKKVANVAEEEKTFMEKDLKIESTVGDFIDGQEIELKLSNGFEFAAVEEGTHGNYSLDKVDDDKVVVTVVGNGVDTIEIDADFIEIEAVSAKSGAVATIKVKATNNVAGAFNATASVEVAKVIDYTVVMSVDADEDIPVIYSGVNVDNDGITDDSDHKSLEVTIEESFPGAWSMRKGFNLELPDGVYVTDVDVTETEGLLKNGGSQNKADVEKAFYDAYQDGDHKGFEFEKRVFDDVNNKLEDDCATMTFKLQLVADPTFSGDVDLKFTGDLVDEQEVTIAKFVPIATVEAEQNDLKIDYRYTEIPTAIKVKETEAGLWGEGAEFWVALEKGNYIEFEDDATFEVTGGLEIDDFTGKDRPNWDDDDVASLGFAVDEESDEAATVTIKDMSLFMQRNIPAGAYDLTAGSTVFKAYQTQKLYAPDCNNDGCDGTCSDKNNDCIIDDIADFSEVVKEAFVNIVTAGREQDDASFTTKVVVPIGESYIVAGEKQVALDVPAYVSTAGYTMLPVRAVATALGINNNNVIWNGETKTVTILYGQRIITMVAGQKVVNVNGSVIPASAAVEIVDGRTFLPMRDLATALGVTDITWDAATKTATLNGGVTAE